MAKPKKYLSIIDLQPFEQDWKRLGLTEQDHEALEEAILENPTAYPVVRGTSGLRKMRFAPPSWRMGKSGAVRVLYVIFAAHGCILLVTAYAKNEQENLDAAEKKAINGWIAEVKDDLDRANQKRKDQP